MADSQNVHAVRQNFPGEKTLVLPKHRGLLLQCLRLIASKRVCKLRSQQTKDASDSWMKIANAMFDVSTGCARGYEVWTVRVPTRMKERFFYAISFYNSECKEKIEKGMMPTELEGLARELQNDLDLAKSGAAQEKAAANERQRENDRQEDFMGLLPPSDRGVGAPRDTAMTPAINNALQLLTRNPSGMFDIFML